MICFVNSQTFFAFRDLCVGCIDSCDHVRYIELIEAVLGNRQPSIVLGFLMF